MSADNDQRAAVPDADAVSAQFGLGRARGALTFVACGQSNPLGVWRLNCERGVYAVKCYTRAPRPEAMAAEVAAHAAGGPLPRPIASTLGAHHAPIRIGTRVAVARVTEWIDGSAFDWHTVDAAVSARVGALMAVIHSVPPPAELTLEPPLTPLDAAGWRLLAARARQRRLPWADAALAAVPALAAHASVAAEARVVGAPVLSQRDYHPPNVIAQPDGRLMLVDWDAAGLADANADVAQYAFVWATHASGAVDDTVAAAFVRGYVEAGGVLHQPRSRDFAPASAGLLSWITHNARRDLDDPASGDPGLTLALLAGLRAPDVDELARRAAVLERALKPRFRR